MTTRAHNKCRADPDKYEVDKRRNRHRCHGPHLCPDAMAPGAGRRVVLFVQQSRQLRWSDTADRAAIVPVRLP